MNKRFPVEFQEAWAAIGIKAAFVQDNEPIPGRNDCANCGGRGFMASFIATKGPFAHPSSALDEVSHWHDGKWWIGKTITAICPVCRGSNPEITVPEEAPALKAGRPKSMADALKKYERT